MTDLQLHSELLEKKTKYTINLKSYEDIPTPIISFNMSLNQFQLADAQNFKQYDNKVLWLLHRNAITVGIYHEATMSFELSPLGKSSSAHNMILNILSTYSSRNYVSRL